MKFTSEQIKKHMVTRLNAYFNFKYPGKTDAFIARDLDYTRSRFHELRNPESDSLISMENGVNLIHRIKQYNPELSMDYFFMPDSSPK